MNAVGLHNHGYFLQFLTMTFTAGLVYLSMNVECTFKTNLYEKNYFYYFIDLSTHGMQLNSLFDWSWSSFKVGMATCPISSLFLILTGWIIFWVGALFFFQIYLLYRGLTTMESMMQEHETVSAYSRGWCWNIVDVLQGPGSIPFDWTSCFNIADWHIAQERHQDSSSHTTPFINKNLSQVL